MKSAALAFRIANVSMALAIVATLGTLFLSSLGCSAPTEPANALDRDDSLAIRAILGANRHTWPTEYWRIGRNSSGRATSLQFNGYGLDTIPAAIGNLFALTELNLSDNKLRALPHEMDALTELTDLRLNHNQLVKLPDGIRLPKLTHLDISANHLTALPTNVDVTQVSILQLDSNRIQSLPPDFRFLTALSVFGIRDNLLDSLPADFSGVTHPALRRLDVSGNRLVSLPAGFPTLALEWVDVGRNRICFPNPAQPDSAHGAMAQWLDGLDRDWRTTQQCP